MYCFFGGWLLFVYLVARFCAAVRLLSCLAVWIFVGLVNSVGYVSICCGLYWLAGIAVLVT